MIKWFLIGCAIVLVIVGAPLIWDLLPWQVQEKIVLVGLFIAASALVGFLAWFFYTGFTG